MKIPLLRTYLFSSVAIVLAIFLGWILIPEEDLIVATEKWKGVCWVGSRNPLQGQELNILKETGANAISQTPFGWQTEKNDPEIRWEIKSEGKWWGETAHGIKATLDSSANHGIMNMLKPHIWVRGSWPGEIEMLNEEDWRTWFDNYQGFILDYAKLAEEYQIPILCIGTELELTSEKDQEWRDIIAEIRKVYSGKLIYAANFTEYDKVTFWDELDYIGIQAYFPLSTQDNPDLEELKSGWTSHLKKIDRMVRKYKKPVMFTEIGYCNTVDAAVEPWIWPNERMETALSEEMQALCYKAFFETAWEKPWMAGVFFWKWYPESRDRGPDFTPQGKLAQKVMEEYFAEN